MESGKVCCKIS